MENSTFRVFVSSTCDDMQPYREAMEKAIIRAKCTPIGMEYFGAASVPPLSRCFEELKSCQIYICAIGMRYGFVDGSTNKSYTQLEYEKAIELDIPVLAFLIDEERMTFHVNEIDHGKKWNKLTNFKNKIKNSKKFTCDFFDSPQSLEIKVYQALLGEMKRYSEIIALENISEDMYKDSEKDIMTIIAEDGSEEKVEVILAFEFKDTKKEYVVYTKGEIDEDGNNTVYVSNVNRINGSPELLGVESEKEWIRIKDVLRELSDDLEEKKNPRKKVPQYSKDGIEIL